MIFNIRQVDDGLVLDVRVRPSAKKSEITGLHDGALKVSVAAPPENGKANQAVVELFSELLGIRKSDIEIIRGHTSRNKNVLFRNISEAGLGKLIVLASKGRPPSE